MVSHPFAAKGSVALLGLLAFIPHAPAELPFSSATHASVITSMTMRATTASTTDASGRYTIVLNDITQNSVRATLEYHNCTATECLANGSPQLTMVFGVGSRVRYAGHTFALTQIASNSATFSVSE